MKKHKHLHFFTVLLAVGCFLFCFWWVLGHRTAESNLEENRDVQTRTIRDRFKSTHTRAPNTRSDFQTSKFYRTIIDNNLFRPLGWRPPRPREPYRLIGTIIPTDGKIGAQAILQTTRGNTTYTVTTGDTLDAGTTVIDIQAKQVTLEKAGKQRTLKLNTAPWLK